MGYRGGYVRTYPNRSYFVKNPERPLQAPDRVLISLLILQAELQERVTEGHDPEGVHQDMLNKVNSCLYTEYPAGGPSAIKERCMKLYQKGHRKEATELYRGYFQEVEANIQEMLSGKELQA